MCYPLTDEDRQWAWDTKTKTEAAGLLNNIQSSEFLVSIYTSHYFFGYQFLNQLQGPKQRCPFSISGDMGNAITCVCDARAESEE